MDRDIKGVPSPEYLWKVKHVVPFLKIDKGLADAADGVQMMKPMPGLDLLLERAKAKAVFGTKERSVVKEANAKGVAAIVRQQFDVAKQVLAHEPCRSLSPRLTSSAPTRRRPRSSRGRRSWRLSTSSRPANS